jgi:hypothetical protein
VDYKHIKSVELMLSFNASPLIKDRNGKTLLDLAEGPEMQRVLVEPKREIVDSPKFASPKPPSQRSFTDSVASLDVTSCCKEPNPVLNGWLSSIKLEHLCDVFMEGGYDDVEAMISQMRSRMPITRKTLREIGVEKPGYVARILAKLEDESVGKTTRRRRRSIPSSKTNSNPFACCALPAPAPGMFSLPTLSQWLERINLTELYENFEQSGYDDLE